MTTPSVAILGSGLAGLTLGRRLRQRGIRSVIYERASGSPRHNYGITLQPWAYSPLLKVLDLDEATFRRRVAVDSFSDTGGGRFSQCDASISIPFMANRHKFESVLREGQTIHLEHCLSSATLGDDGVELSFQNGLNLSSGLVVDAEGVHSKLRKSLLPETSLEIHPFAVYSSKRYIGSDTFASCYAVAFRDGNVIVHDPEQVGGPRLEISVNERQPDGTVSISYVYSRGAKQEGNPDPLHRPEHPNAGPTDIPEEFYKELEDFIKTSKPGEPFEECFDAQQIRSERLLHWLMRTILVPKQDLQRLLQHGIVMIGDSAHAVPILGGHDANMAISDAIKLAETLEHGQTATQIQRFYDENWRGWRDAVEESKRDLAAMHKDDRLVTSNL